PTAGVRPENYVSGIDLELARGLARGINHDDDYGWNDVSNDVGNRGGDERNVRLPAGRVVSGHRSASFVRRARFGRASDLRARTRQDAMAERRSDRDGTRHLVHALRGNAGVSTAGAGVVRLAVGIGFAV